MKPHVICHMASSVDGRITSGRWRPERAAALTSLYEQLHDKLGCDAWLVGRVTGQAFAKTKAYPQAAAQPIPRDSHVVAHDGKTYAVVLDADGRIAWGRRDIGGDPIVVILTQKVSDAHLAGLRGDGISYVFAGERSLDLAAALETLNRTLGVKRVLLEGGGVANGAFLRAGLVDELSLVIYPTVDGAKGANSVFDSTDAEAGAVSPVHAMRLEHCETLEGGAVWLRYAMQ